MLMELLIESHTELTLLSILLDREIYDYNILSRMRLHYLNVLSGLSFSKEQGVIGYSSRFINISDCIKKENYPVRIDDHIRYIGWC